MGKDGKERLGRVSRRGFFGSVAAGAAGTAALAAGEVRGAPPPAVEAGARLALTLNVNGRDHDLEVEPRETLISVLRERLGLMGTKPGCERGECGACTVLIEGVARYACLTLAIEAAGARITTIEGLMDGEKLGPVQQAFVAEDAFQCGYCAPGQQMAVESLLRQIPDPTDAQIREGVSGVLCRCGAYGHIFKAARRAAGERKRKAS